MIGILGGTFDPVHYGHLRPAVELLQELDFDEVRLVPCHVPPHRESPRATPAQRLAMLEAAIKGERALAVDDRELRRAGPSYMVDTLASLRAELGARPIALILGMDAFRALASWHRWQELIGLAHLVVMRRPGAALPEEGEVARLVGAHLVHDPARLREHPAGHILTWSVTQMDISASSIRAQIAAGASPRYLLPDDVLALIRHWDLYRD